MLVIGLTGGIGSGKSIVADLFAARGVPIIDADVIAREVTQPGTPALSEIVSHFGRDILNKNRSLNRTALRAKIFGNNDDRIWLEKLLHPLIQTRITTAIKQLNSVYCLVVIPLLLETEANPLIARILVVDTSEQKQIERVTQRDKTTTEQVQAILATQMGRAERLKRADDVIKNDGSLAELESEVEKLHQKYLNL